MYRQTETENSNLESERDKRYRQTETELQETMREIQTDRERCKRP
jgi:hypothetical protein